MYDEYIHHKKKNPLLKYHVRSYCSLKIWHTIRIWTDYAAFAVAVATFTFGMPIHRLHKTDKLIVQHILSITSLISFLSIPIPRLILERNDVQYLPFHFSHEFGRRKETT